MAILGASTQSAVDRLKRERDRFVAFAFASADILMELDVDGKIIYADGATKRLLDRTSEELNGTNFLNIIHDEDHDLGEHLLQTDSRARVDNVAIRLKTKNNTPFPLIISGYKISELQGHFYLTFSTFRNDINMGDVSRRDLRTGLLRKGEFSLLVNKQIILSKISDRKLNLSIITIEHISGVARASREEDEIYRQVSDIARAYSVSGDSAGLVSDNSIGFIHSDEVSIEEVRMLIGGMGGIQLRTATISLETNSDVTEEDTVQAIIYTFNKFSTHNAVDFDHKTLADCYNEMVNDTVRRIAEFKRIMNEGLFDLAFQPIVHVTSGRVSHFEVLTRLKGPTSFANPFAFIEFGESVGLIPEYDMKVVAKAIAILRQHRDHGYTPNVCINLSGSSLSNTSFLQDLYEMLKTEGEICKQLVFEITESARVASIKVVNEYFMKLRELGIKCSIDDFGTGEATFEYLRNLRVDYVKIDGSYITPEAISNEHGRHLLRALSRLCSDMGVEVIGERVENQEASDILAEFGITYGQGYFYAKPTTDTEVLKWQKIDFARGSSVAKMDEYRK